MDWAAADSTKLDLNCALEPKMHTYLKALSRFILSTRCLCVKGYPCTISILDALTRWDRLHFVNVIPVCQGWNTSRIPLNHKHQAHTCAHAHAYTKYVVCACLNTPTATACRAR